MVAPLAIVAALPAIFQAIASSVELFGAAKKTFAEVTGRAPAATSPDGLQAEVAALPAADQARFAEVMAAELQRYRAETERLVTEQGEMTPELLLAIGPDAARRVALARMMTRPLIAMRMSHVVLLPVYVFALDATIMLFNILAAGLGFATRFELLAGALFAEGSVYYQLYTWAAPTAASVIGGYMALRSGEKAANQGNAGGGGLGAAIDGALTAVRGLGGLLKRR